MPDGFTPEKPKKLHLDALDIERRFKHEVSGAQLCIAKTTRAAIDKQSNSNKPRYIMFWAAPWQKTITKYSVYETAEDANAACTLEQQKDPPDTPTLRRDFQVSKVYRWEGATLDKESIKLTPEQMQRVVKKISEDFNMVAPKVKYKDPNPNQANPASYYYAHLNKILMRHKKLSFVIHEVAHAIDHRINGNKWSDHGPSFVRTLIRLAERYQYWHSPEELEESAKKAGIMIAPDSAVPNLPKPK